MPFEFTCPYCFNKTIVEESYAGKEGPCVACGKKIVIPFPETRRAPVAEIPASLPKDVVRKNIVIVKSIGVALACVVVGAAAVLLLWPSVKLLQARRDRYTCMNNLRLIATALDAYAAQNGTYPTPIVRDAKGAPLYSWRVLILPYLGEQDMYERFNLNEAWNGPTNSLLIPEFPEVFTSPVESKGSAVQETSYMLIVGKGTLFPPTGPLGPADVTDGLSETLMVVESANTGVSWAQPVDIDITGLNTKVSTAGTGLLQNVPTVIGGHHEDGATVVFSDGTPGWLPADTSPKAIKGMISPAGNEDINTQSFRE